MTAAEHIADLARPPHCDASILHAPGECRYCDDRAEWQAYRILARINFTGHHDEDKAPCPSSHHRDDEGMGWPGNHPGGYEAGGPLRLDRPRPDWVRGQPEQPERPRAVERALQALFCPGCLCLRFGPGHLARRYLFGIDCSRTW